MQQSPERIGTAASPSPLQRGKACLPCRRRKIRCDSARPVCGPCDRYGRSEDCEYDDGYANPRTQQLEETVNRLEARIQELEIQEPGSRSPESSLAHNSGSLFLGTTDETGIISPALAAHLIDICLRHKAEIPWFLHEDRFRRNISLPRASLESPIPALLTTLHLWGLRFSRRTDLFAYSPTLLNRALSQVGQALNDLPSQRTIEVIQAHILLSTYLSDSSRDLEARSHSSSAASLALRLGLHKMYSSQRNSTRAFGFNDPVETPLRLPQSRDAIEEGERINAFWTVFCQDRLFAAVYRVLPSIEDRQDVSRQIDTPWPLSMEAYERGLPGAVVLSSGTVSGYLFGMNVPAGARDGILAESCKAALLFERTTRLGNVRIPGAAMTNELYAEYLSLSARIEELKRVVPPHAYPIICTLHGATIQLQAVFAEQSTEARDKSLSAAFSIVQASTATQLQNYAFLHPVIGLIWATVCRVLISEIISVRSIYTSAPMAALALREAELTSMLNSMQASLAAFAPNSLAMNYHLSRIDQERMGALAT